MSYFCLEKKTQTYASGKIKKVDESTYAHTSLLYHKIKKKSITIQAMFVSLSRSKVLSSLALAVHFRVELCQIRGPINKSHVCGIFISAFLFGREKLIVEAEEDTGQQEEAKLSEIRQRSFVGRGGKEDNLKHAVDKDAGKRQREQLHIQSSALFF